MSEPPDSDATVVESGKPDARRSPEDDRPAGATAVESDDGRGDPTAGDAVFFMRSGESLVPGTLHSGQTGGVMPGPGRSRFARGVEFSHYIVLDKLGAGGMGEVLAAYDTRLDRKVAIKVLRSDTWQARTAGKRRARLVREARAMAKVSHPNVVTVYEVGTVDDDGADAATEGQIYIAMEYVAGHTLTSWLREKRPSWREIVDIFIRAGRGLEAAHAVGLVHRDFKPDNVLVGEDGRPQVTDFGIVGVEGTTPEPGGGVPVSPLGDSLTETGTVLGTWMYMPPEQQAGEATDARADQFAFCVALYRALYRQRPFAGESAFEIAANVCAGNVREPPRDSDVPAWVREPVLRGLSRLRDDRFPTMADLLAALGDDPTLRRRPWPLRIAVVFLVAVAAYGLLRPGDAPEPPCRDAGASLVRVWNPAARQKLRDGFTATRLAYADDAATLTIRGIDDYARAWTTMRTEACEATRVRGEQSEALLDRRIACLDRRLREAGSLIARLSEADAKTVERAVRAVDSLASLEPCADSDRLTSLVRPPEGQMDEVRAIEEMLATARAEQRLARYKGALELAEKARERAEALGYGPLVAEARFRHGALLLDLDRIAEAETVLVAAERSADAARHDRLRVLADDALTAAVGHNQHRYADGREWAARAFTALERLDVRDTLAADIESTLGTVAEVEGKYDEALEHHEKALAEREKKLGPEHTDVAISLNNLGGILYAQGKYAEALGYFDRTEDIFAKRLGASHPHTLSTAFNHTNVLLALEKYDQVLPEYERILELRRQVLGAHHPEVADVHNNMGIAYDNLGRYQEALDSYGRAVAIHEKRRDEGGKNAGNSNQLAMLYTNIGINYMLQRKFAEADAELRRALDIRLEVLGPDHPSVALVHDNLGEVLLEQKKFAEAKAHFERALTIWTEKLPPDHDLLAGPHAGLGRIAFAKGKLGRAMTAFQRALAIQEKALGPEARELIATLHDIGRVHLRRNKPDKARAVLERAEGLIPAEGPDSTAGLVRFDLARALWDSGRRSAADRKRAVTLAGRARDHLRRAGKDVHASDLEVIERWLRKRKSP